MGAVDGGVAMRVKKIFHCDSNIPSDTEILECIQISKLEDCAVELQWYVEWSGWYSIIIDSSKSFLDYKRQIISQVYPI